MIATFLSKLGLAGATISSLFFVNLPTSKISFSNTNLKIEKEQDIEIRSIEDIELFEKINNCYFVHVKSWKNPKMELYGAKEFSEKEASLKNKLISGAHLNKTKELCKQQKGVITLFYSTTNREFALSDPQGGW